MRNDTIEDFQKQIKQLETGCIVWTGGKNGNGYGVFRFNRKVWLTHRLAWFLKNGSIKDKLNILHKCDNPSCLNLDHLFVGTHRQNMEDRNQKGRQTRGEDVHSAKLTEHEVKTIRLLFSTIDIPYLHLKLAKLFKIKASTIYFITGRKRWKHVPDFSIIEAAQIFQQYKNHFQI
jgi:hypothetical protein